MASWKRINSLTGQNNTDAFHLPLKWRVLLSKLNFKALNTFELSFEPLTDVFTKVFDESAWIFHFFVDFKKDGCVVDGVLNIIGFACSRKICTYLYVNEIGVPDKLLLIKNAVKGVELHLVECKKVHGILFCSCKCTLFFQYKL